MFSEDGAEWVVIWEQGCKCHTQVNISNSRFIHFPEGIRIQGGHECHVVEEQVEVETVSL
jgi:hypothetical protein